MGLLAVQVPLEGAPAHDCLGGVGHIHILVQGGVPPGGVLVGDDGGAGDALVEHCLQDALQHDSLFPAGGRRRGGAANAGYRGYVIQVGGAGLREFGAILIDAGDGILAAVVESFGAAEEPAHGCHVGVGQTVLHSEDFAADVRQGVFGEGFGVEAGFQGGGDEPVAHGEEVAKSVDVLPVEVGVPDGGAGEGDGGDVMAAAAQRVFDVIPLEEEGDGQAHAVNGFGGDEAGPPAVVFGVEAAFGQFPVHHAGVGDAVWVGEGAAAEGAEVDAFGGGEEEVRVEEEHHLRADDGGCAGEGREGAHADDGFGLDADVVIHEEDVDGGVVFGGFEDAAGEAAGAAQIGLLDVVEGAAEGFGSFLEFGLFADVLGALVGDVEFVDEGADEAVVGEGGDGGGAVDGPVEGADGDGETAASVGAVGDGVLGVFVSGGPGGYFGVAAGGGGEGEGVPFDVADAGFTFAGGEFEPEGAAVVEAVKGDGEGEGVRAFVDGFADGAFVAADVGGADEDGGVDVGVGGDGAGDFDGGDAGPALPVGGGEAAEVGVGGECCPAVDDDVVAGAERVAGAVSSVEVLVHPGAGPGEESAL